MAEAPLTVKVRMDPLPALRTLLALAEQLYEDRPSTDPKIEEGIRQARETVARLEAEKHVVTITETNWNLEHPLACRPDIAGCVLNEWLLTNEAPEVEPGRYFIEWRVNGAHYAPFPPEEIG